MTREHIGWALAGAGLLCGVLGAYLKTGTSDALITAGAGLTALAGAFGYVNKTTGK